MRRLARRHLALAHFCLSSVYRPKVERAIDVEMLMPLRRSQDRFCCVLRDRRLGLRRFAGVSSIRHDGAAAVKIAHGQSGSAFAAGP